MKSQLLDIRSEEEKQILEFYRLLKNKKNEKPKMFGTESYFKSFYKVIKVIKETFPELEEVNSFNQLVQYFLYEGLIKTFSSNQTSSVLQKAGYTKNDFEYDKDSNIFFFFFPMYKYINAGIEQERILSELVRIQSYMSNCGWFIGTCIDMRNQRNIIKTDEIKKVFDKLVKMNYLQITFQPKYTQELDKIDYPKFGYHITNNLFIEKIKKIGLTPKTKSKLSNHPARIYLTQTFNDAKKIAKLLFPAKERRVNIIFFLKINLHDFSGKLFIDNMANTQVGYEKDCLWTNENISPTLIEVIKEENLSV